jgi:hypothetical protein
MLSHVIPKVVFHEKSPRVKTPELLSYNGEREIRTLGDD